MRNIQGGVEGCGSGNQSESAEVSVCWFPPPRISYDTVDNNSRRQLEKVKLMRRCHEEDGEAATSNVKAAATVL